MNDTVAAVKLLALSALAATACTTDPTLAVSVQHDPAYTSLIAKTVVSVYEADGLTCDQVAYGDITDDELRGSLTAEATEGESLSGVSRLGHKVIVARGFDPNDALVTAGCGELDEISGSDHLSITTIAAATVAVANAQDGTGALVVTTTDARFQSIDQRQVLWRVYGAAGTSADPVYTSLGDGIWEPSGPSCTADGEVVVHPAAPKLPGGYATRVMVRWAAATPPLLTAFTPVDTFSAQLGTSDPDIVNPCAIRRSGAQTSIVCLADKTTAVAYTLTTSGLVKSPTTASINSAIGVVAVPAANGDQNIYAIDNLGNWQAVFGAPAANGGPGSNWWCGGATSNFHCLLPATFKTTQLQVVPACGTAPGFLLGVTSEGPTHLRQVPLLGGAVSDYHGLASGEIKNAGCITELQLDGSTLLRQAVVIGLTIADGVPAPVTAAVFDCSSTRTPCSIALPTNAGVGFLPGTESRLVGASFDATGTLIESWAVQPLDLAGQPGAKDRLVERVRQQAAAPPRQLITGQFDHDGQPDLVWDFVIRTDPFIQIAYARQVESAPLSAIAPVPDVAGVTPVITNTFAADLDGDGYDEIIAVTQLGVVTPTEAIAVVRTGVPYSMQLPTTPDAMCAR